MKYFLAGCIGALAPEIVRLYEWRERRKSIRFSKFYLLVSLAYVLLGGYVASIFPVRDSEFLAFVVGVGLVGTVNTLSRVAGRLTRRYMSVQIEQIIEKLGGKGGRKDTPEFTRKPKYGDFWDYTDLL